MAAGDVNDPTQNSTLYDESGNPVEIELLSGKYKLHVAAEITGGGVSLERFRPRFFTSKADITILTTDTTLKSLSFTGQLDAISINTSDKNIEIILEVDSTEIFRVNSADLNDSGEYRLQMGGSILFPVMVDDQGKHWMLDYKNTPPDIVTNLTIKAKSTSGGTEVMKSIVIVYREKV